VILFRSQRSALAAAVVFTAAAAVCWRDAYEGRGRRRPLWTKAAGVIL